MAHRVFSSVKAIVRDGNRFLILKRTLGDYMYWELPGGIIQYEETPYETLEREVEEEAGIVIEKIEPAGIYWFFRVYDADQVICTTFLCRPKTTNVTLQAGTGESETFEDFKWVTKEEFLNDDYTAPHHSLKELISKVM